MTKNFSKLMWVLAVFALYLFPAFGQSPNSMSYQAVIRNSSDALVTNTQIGMEINIRQGSVSGTVVYTETQTPTTNANGLVSIEIGSGADFTTIDWAAGPYFMETKTDPTGGTNYTLTGTSQLLSVPYALHAKTAETVTGGITETDPVFNASVASGITATDTANWNKKLDSYTETQNLDSVLTQGTSAGNKNITNLADPVNAQDATTKAYVDALLARIEALEESDLLNNGFTDPRDGNHYKVVKIGDQVWMAENLKYLPSVVVPDTVSQTVPYYYVYDYNGTHVDSAKATSNYQTYGVLYNWTAAMDSAASSTANPSGVQGVCPAGWHLPSDAEWTALENYLIANGYNYDGTTTGNRISKAMAATTGWNSSSNTGAVGNTDYPAYQNKSGFTALPGSRNDRGNFNLIGEGSEGFWWSATESSISRLALYRVIRSTGNSLGSGNLYKENGLSVRCVKD